MNICQTLTVDLEEELANTRKLLALVPLTDELRKYKPHPKSMELDRLATHVAELPSWPAMILESEVFTLPEDFKPHALATTAELLETFDKAAEQGRQAIAAAPDEAMSKDWTFRYKDFSFSTPRVKMLRSAVNHLVHHRAQLGVYLRLNGIAIPGMYGPSADDGWN